MQNNIRLIRERRGISQEMLANRIAVDASVINAWENGTADPSANDLLAIKDVLGVRLDDLFSKKQTNRHVYEKPVRRGAWIAISWILFAGCFMSIFAGLYLESCLPYDSISFNENMWVYYIFTPIPIASIVIGFIMKKKHLGGTRNIVVGFIFLTLLVIYGSFIFIDFPDALYYSDFFDTDIETIGLRFSHAKTVISAL